MKRLFFYIIFIFILTNIGYSTDIDLTFKNPIHDSKSNTHLMYTANSLVNWGIESLFIELGSRESSFARFSEYLLNIYTAAFFTSFSHEWAHYRLAYYYGLNPSIKIYFFGGEVRHNYTSNTENELKIVAAGVNQQEWNAEFIFEKMVLSGKMTYHNGLMLNANRMGVFAYSLVTLAGYTSSGNDIISYETLTKQMGYKVNRNEMFIYSSLSLLLSYSFWENFYIAYHFVDNDLREKPIRVLWKTIVPPLFQYYLTEFGDLFSIKLPVVQPIPIFLWYGFGIKKEIHRLGAKVFFFESYRVSLSPYYYLTSIRSSNILGHLIGLDTSVKLYPKEWKVNFTFRFNNNDLFSRLRIEDDYYFSLGSSYTF